MQPLHAKRLRPSPEARFLARLERRFGVGRGRAIFIAIAAVPWIGAIVLLPATMWVMLRPFSEGIGSTAHMLREMGLVPALMYLCVAPFITLKALYPGVAKWKRWLADWAILVIGVALLYLSGTVEDRGRTTRLKEVADSLAPLTQAIHEYRAVAGGYPARLDQLIPTHIAAIPGTGMCAYPQIHYRRDDHAEYDRSEEGEQTGGYELLIYTPSGGINFDKFYYWPSGAYPAEHPAGRLERIGDWVYLHE